MRVLQLCIAKHFHIWVSSSIVSQWPSSSSLCAAFPSNPTLTVFSFASSSSSVSLAAHLHGHGHPWKGQSPCPEVVACWGFSSGVARKKPAEFEFGLKFAIAFCQVLTSLLPSHSHPCHYHDKVRAGRTTACTFAMGTEARWLCRHNEGDWYTDEDEFLWVICAYTHRVRSCQRWWRFMGYYNDDETKVAAHLMG